MTSTHLSSGPLPSGPFPSGPLPSGTVTFLFTDVEGSTRLWEEDAPAMQAALAQHDQVLRGAIESRGGHVFKTVGDAFCAVFARAPDALAAALAAQRDLAASDGGEPGGGERGRPRVRIALHAGEAEERSGDYFGRAVNRVARLLAIGHGGQTLLSQTTRDLVRDALPSTSALKDLGQHRLKDLQRPEHVFQLETAGLASHFPPLKSLDTLPNNLPLQLTSLVGREAEIGTVKDLLGARRLVTLTGAAGSGKTRLVLQVAAELLEEFPDGVWLVELATIVDPGLVPQSVATALRVREVPGRPLAETMGEYLATRTLLVVLDNCEHLIEASAAWAEYALRAGSGVRLLATSREALGTAGEAVWLVPSLPAPDPRRLPPEAAPVVAGSEAARLFVERAALAQPGFAVSEANARPIAQICHRLDGIPLAIELAAARVRVLAVEQIAARLDDRFRLLTGGGRTALPRHQTLRAAMDWSYDLLEPSEQALLRRLSVFVGGWTLEAAEAVCATDAATGEGTGAGADAAIEPFDVLDLLSHLVDKSLVGVEPADGGGMRYRMLETARQYGLDKLLESGETVAVRERHREWFLALAEAAEPGMVSRDTAAWFERLETEHDNLRAALEWSLAGGGEPGAGLRMASKLPRFWSARGYMTEGIEWLERALAMAHDPAVAADSTVTDDSTAAGRSATLRFRVQYWLCVFYNDAGRDERSRALGMESLALARAVGNRQGLVWSLQSAARAARADGDPAAAIAMAEEGLALAREIGDRGSESVLVTQLGEVVRAEGDLDRAKKHYQDSLAIAREVGNPSHEDVALFNLGQVALGQGDVAAAEAFYREGLQLSIRIGRKDMPVYLMVGMGQVFAERGEAGRAARLFGAAGVLREAMGTVVDPTDRPLYDRAVAAVREALGESDFDAQWAAGRAMTREEALAEALGESSAAPVS